MQSKNKLALCLENGKNTNTLHPLKLRLMLGSATVESRSWVSKINYPSCKGKLSSKRLCSLRCPVTLFISSSTTSLPSKCMRICLVCISQPIQPESHNCGKYLCCFRVCRHSVCKSASQEVKGNLWRTLRRLHLAIRGRGICYHIARKWLEPCIHTIITSAGW